MSLPPEQEVENMADDWGNFDAVIHQLENEEQAHSEHSGELSTAVDVDNTASLQAFLEVMFMVVEKGTAMFSGVDFKFDEQSREEVTQAAVPVLSKHGTAVSGWFGDYLEEATLALAVLGLIYTTRMNLKTLKAEKRRAQDEEGHASQTA